MLLSQTLWAAGIDAMLATLGNTNPSPKWRLELLRRFAGAADTALLPEDSERLDSFYIDRMTFAGYERADPRIYCRDAIHFANRMALWAGDRVLFGRAAPAPAATPRGVGVALSKVPPGFAARKLPPLSPSVMLRRRKDEYVVEHLGDEVSLIVNTAWVELALCFDGVTTLKQAVAQLLRRTNLSEETLVESLAGAETFLEYWGCLDTHKPTGRGGLSSDGKSQGKGQDRGRRAPSAGGCRANVRRSESPDR
jgi:hypothetical protein